MSVRKNPRDEYYAQRSDAQENIRYKTFIKGVHRQTPLILLLFWSCTDGPVSQMICVADDLHLPPGVNTQYKTKGKKPVSTPLACDQQFHAVLFTFCVVS